MSEKKLLSDDNMDIPVEPLKDSDPLPIGNKFKGEKIGDVPAWYLLWLLDEYENLKSHSPRLYAYLEKNRAYLEREKASNGR